MMAQSLADTRKSSDFVYDQSMSDAIIKELDLAEVIARFGQDMLAIDVEQHLRCSRCRQNDAEMKVAPKRTNGQ